MMKTRDSRVKRRGTPVSRDGRPDWPWSKNGKPDPAILADIVRRIVAAAKPEKIVLFGSAARGTMKPDSDYDLLVIQGGKFNYWRLMSKIRRQLRGKGAPVDIVLVSASDAERYRQTPCLVICPALEEGKVVYDSKASAGKRSA
jgi:predicted nucleotidyltransferase